MKFILLTFLIFGIYFIFFTGPRKLSDYPAKGVSPYRLPWKAGDSYYVSQGNRSFLGHRFGLEYSYDFHMPTGTPLLAARGGKVIKANDFNDGLGIGKGNAISILHDDNMVSSYLHIGYKTARVKVGDIIKQGQEIALSDMVGLAINPHLHIHVTQLNSTKTVPFTFFEVEPDGIPIAGKSYVSRNNQ